MDFRIISSVFIFAIIALVIGLMIPGGNESPEQIFPWQIEKTTAGTTRVFGITLGESHLQQAEQIFQAKAELSMFVPADNKQQPVIEAYFDKVTLGGLSAKAILVFEFTPEQLHIMYERGSRISTLGDGSRKVSLHSQDIETIQRSTVTSITYLPRIQLDNNLLEKRFGKPEQVIQEKDSSTAHWLYPDRGLDVALDEHGNGVLQYVAPTQFEKLTAPLK